MVIERALEKMRRDIAAKADARPAMPAGSRPIPKHHRDGVRDPAREPVNVAAIVRPVYPQLTCERDAVITHRLLVPDTPLASNERVAAAYRMIRTRLLHTVRTNNLTTIAITSPGAGEGKSITSINIALSLARDPTATVFLLDLDMRNPSICRYLGVRPPHELISYFTGDIPPQDVFFAIGPENLAIAGSVTTSDQASELIGSGQLEALVGYIHSVASNPIVLIDLPPVLVTDEALLVAPRVDATLLVVAEGRTRRDSLTQAKSMLAEFPSAGVLLNRSTEFMGASGYYYNNYG